MTPEPRRDFGGQRPYPRDDRPAPLELPDGYLAKGYFDGGNVLPEIIQDWPKEIAQTFKRGNLKSTQLRRFYNKAKAIEGKLKSGQPYDKLKEEIMTLQPLAAAAVGKKNAPEVFHKFMELNVHNAIKSQEDFTRGFIIHLQSIVAYTKYFEENA